MLGVPIIHSFVDVADIVAGQCMEVLSREVLTNVGPDLGVLTNVEPQQNKEGGGFLLVAFNYL